MVFQQKVGSATKNKSKKAMQSPKPSMFELNADDDSEDMDSDDCAESSDKEMDSDDVQEPPKTSIKKTPQAKTPSKQTPGKQNLAKQTPGKQNLAKQTPGKQTPNKRNSLVPDKKVSFELASASKTPTATDSQVGKRQATPASKSKQGVQEFKGLKAGLKNKSQTSLKMEEDSEEEDDDSEEEDDDSEEEDDDSDDSKQNALKSKLKQKITNNQNTKEEEDDDDDDDEEEDDDDEEDDDEEEEEDDDDDDEEEEEDEEDDSKQIVLKNNSKQLKEASSPTKTDDSLTKQNEKNLIMTQKNKEAEDLRESRQLMFRQLPIDITCEEIKSLSDDILYVTLPDPAFIKQRKFTNVYCFLQFANAEKAEKNYAAFQNQTLRGVPIECDYTGVKSKLPRTKKNVHDAVYDAKRIHIAGLQFDIKVMQIAELTPSATSILINASTANRAAFVSFDSEEAAAEAFEANKEAKINGLPVTVLYALNRKASNMSPFKREFQKGGQPPFAKRPRQDLDVSSQD